MPNKSEMKSLTKEDFVRILKESSGSVLKSCVTIIRTEDKGPGTKFLGLFDHDIDPDEYICIVDVIY